MNGENAPPIPPTAFEQLDEALKAALARCALLKPISGHGIHPYYGHYKIDHAYPLCEPFSKNSVVVDKSGRIRIFGERKELTTQMTGINRLKISGENTRKNVNSLKVAIVSIPFSPSINILEKFFKVDSAAYHETSGKSQHWTITVDHVLERTQGGTNHFHNLVLVTASYNSTKSNRINTERHIKSAITRSPIIQVCRRLTGWEDARMADIQKEGYNLSTISAFIKSADKTSTKMIRHDTADVILVRRHPDSMTKADFEAAGGKMAIYLDGNTTKVSETVLVNKRGEVLTTKGEIRSRGYPLPNREQLDSMVVVDFKFEARQVRVSVHHAVYMTFRGENDPIPGNGKIIAHDESNPATYITIDEITRKIVEETEDPDTRLARDDDNGRRIIYSNHFETLRVTDQSKNLTESGKSKRMYNGTKACLAAKIPITKDVWLPDALFVHYTDLERMKASHRAGLATADDCPPEPNDIIEVDKVNCYTEPDKTDDGGCEPDETDDGGCEPDNDDDDDDAQGEWTAFKFLSREGVHAAPCEALSNNIFDAEVSRIAMESTGWIPRSKVSDYEPNYGAPRIYTLVKNHSEHMAAHAGNPEPPLFILTLVNSKTGMPDIFVRSSPLVESATAHPGSGKPKIKSEYLPMAPCRAKALLTTKWTSYEKQSDFADYHDCDPMRVSGLITEYMDNKNSFISGERAFHIIGSRKGRGDAILRDNIRFPLPNNLDGDNWKEAQLEGHTITGLYIHRDGRIFHKSAKYVDRGRYTEHKLHALMKINRPEIIKSDVDILRLSFETFSNTTPTACPLVDWFHQDAFIAVNNESAECYPQPTWKGFCDSGHDASTFQVVYKNSYESIRNDMLQATKDHHKRERQRAYNVFFEQRLIPARPPNDGISDLLMIYLHMRTPQGGRVKRPSGNLKRRHKE